jgi:hypothetical protein
MRLTAFGPDADRRTTAISDSANFPAVPLASLQTQNLPFIQTGTLRRSSTDQSSTGNGN